MTNNQTGASSTPRPFTNPDTFDKVARNQQESEKWDDLIAIIYSKQTQGDTFIWSTFSTWAGLQRVDVPCPVDVRLDCFAYWSPVEQPSSNMAIELGITATPIIGGTAATNPPSDIAVSETLPATGVGAFENVALSVGGTIDVTPGLWAVESVVLMSGSGSIQLNNSGIKVRRGRKPVS